MRSIPLMAVGLTVAMAMAACGGDDDGGGNIPLDQFDEKLAESFCANVFKCCDMAERTAQFMFFDPPPTTEAECRSTISAFYGALIASDEGLMSGRVEYDGAAAGDCVAALDAAACGNESNQVQDDNGACGQFLHGTVATGGACSNDDECADDSQFCAGGDDDVDGACTARPAVGAACPDFECVETAYCDFTSEMCIARKANGMTCDDDDECTSDYCDTTCMAEPETTTCDGN